MFTELKIGNEIYKLRLTTRYTVSLEKSLGYNPITIFLELDAGKMPKLNDLLMILHACLQPYNHGISLDKVYDLYDKYIDDGHNMFDLIPVFLEVFQESGYIGKPEDPDSEEFNGEDSKN